MAGSLSMWRQVDIKSPDIYLIITAGKVPPRPDWDPSIPGSPQVLPERSLGRETGDLSSPGTHVGSTGSGVQRTHFSPRHLARGRKRCPPREAGKRPETRAAFHSATRGAASQNPHAAAVRPELQKGTPALGGPPPSGSPGPGSGGAASPASRTAPARRAGARSASGGTAPRRPPCCADATRPRPLAPSSRGPGPGPDQWGRRGGAGGREPERDKGLRAESSRRANLGRPGYSLPASHLSRAPGRSPAPAAPRGGTPSARR